MSPEARITLTKLEGELMRVVWQAEPDPVRVRDVVAGVNAGRTKPLAYNTIQTMLTILREKGFVELVPGPGRAHRYRPRVSRAEASRHMVSDLVERLFDGRVQTLLQQLIDHSELEAADLHVLREWVDARLRDRDEESS